MTNGSIAVVSGAPEQFGTIALATLRDLLGGFDEPVVGLPTGRTPVALYEAMARRQYTFPPGARLFAIDEYCSPTRREGTNAAFFDRFLPRASCHAAIALPRAAAADSDAEVRRFCAAIADVGGFDVAVVGIGDNGHVAFNEPGSAIDSGCRVIELTASTRAQVDATWTPPPETGMTVGMAQIMAADQVLLLASGPAKSEILSAALTGPVTDHVPASFLQLHPHLTVVADALALSGVSL